MTGRAPFLLLLERALLTETKVESGDVSKQRGTLPPALRVGSNRLSHFPWFALELAGIRRPVAEIWRFEIDELVPLGGLVVPDLLGC